MIPPTIVSAPGKVLVAGGYLVLDRRYTGLVVATSSRFYCVVFPQNQLSSAQLSSSTSASPTTVTSSTTDESTSSGSSSKAKITVRAGQFPEESSVWSYALEPSSDSKGLIISPESDNKNKFVEITLRNALQVVVEHYTGLQGSVEGGVKEVLRRIEEGGGLEVVVLADNDFYSQRESLSSLSLPPVISSLDALEPFTPLPRPIHQTNKTGLGSSAALVTSLTAGLLSHFDVVSIPSSALSTAIHHAPDSIESTGESEPKESAQSSTGDLDLIHNLSQFSHCLAQGKVGSGFDISSAVFGTHIYRRFSPSILTPLMSTPTASSPGSSASTGILPHMDRGKWDHTARPFSLPKGLRLLLADVDAGTDTPSFVGKVLNWRKENEVVADELWGHLGKANDSLGDLLQSLAGLQGEEGYEAVLRDAARVPVSKCDIARPASLLLVKIQAALNLIRSFLQQMSSLSDVPIEPPKQTRLLDACCALPGVVGGTVPGAGGYDALVLLVVDSPEVVAGVEGVWSNWTEMSVCPLSAKQSDGGIQVETLEGVHGLKERLGW